MTIDITVWISIILITNALTGVFCYGLGGRDEAYRQLRAIIKQRKQEQKDGR